MHATLWTSLFLGLIGQTSTSGSLTLSNSRATYGEMGMSRKDLKFPPGDMLFLNFDIVGLKQDEQNRISYSLTMEVLDADGKQIFKQPSIIREDYLALGSARVPARAFVDIGHDSKIGKFVCKVTVVDRISKAIATLEKEFEVVPVDFGIVRFNCLLEPRQDSAPAPLVGAVGQSYLLTFAVIGYKRDSITRQPKLKVTLSAKSKDGKSSLTKPLISPILNDAREGDTGIPLFFPLHLNREGEFIVDIEIVDEVTKRSTKFAIPMTVIDPKN
jgi:hypothetical protein